MQIFDDVDFGNTKRFPYLEKANAAVVQQTIGGGGIKEGFNTFAKNHMAKGALGSKNLLSYTNMKDSTQKALRKPRSK